MNYRAKLKGELLLIDSMLETKTAHQYDAAWKVIKPTKATLGWRAAAIVVHPTNPVSTISYRGLRDVYGGQSKDWFDVAGAERRERERAGSKDGGKDSEAPAPFFGAIDLYGLLAEDPISRLPEMVLAGNNTSRSCPGPISAS